MAPRLLLVTLTILSLASLSAQFTHYEEGSCDLIGDPDLYGIGVRTSYYLTYFSGILALAYGTPNVVKDAKKGAAIIGFAVLIILIQNAVQGSLAVFEWQIIFQMMFTLMVGAYGPLTVLGSKGSSAALCLIYGLYAVLLPWIFFTLGDQGRKDECELKAFLYVYFDFYDVHWVAFQKASSIFTCFTGAFLIIAGVIFAIFMITEDDEDDEGVLSNYPEIEKGFRFGFAVIGLFIGASMIVSTEKLITGNAVDLSEASLSSTNQLIPFLVGLFTSISTVWSVVKERVVKK